MLYPPSAYGPAMEYSPRISPGSELVATSHVPAGSGVIVPGAAVPGAAVPGAVVAGAAVGDGVATGSRVPALVRVICCVTTIVLLLPGVGNPIVNVLV